MNDDRLRRWRLILGGEDAEGTGIDLSGVDEKRDKALDALYGDQDRKGGLGGSSPRVARWLGDIRGYFPASVVQVMQRDAMDRLGLRRLLLEPELLESVQPDVHLVGTLISLNQAIPERSRETARAVVRKVVDELEQRLAQPTRQAVSGALHRAGRTSRPRAGDIDWHRTILANLRHYQPEHRTVIPERLVGYGRRLPQVSREIVLCLDQSGSMASSVVYASVFGAVLASVRSLRTQVIAFDTAVADLTEAVSDPVELLFGVQLGGGTDINAALAYCQTKIENPRDTIVVLISDLYEGGDEDEMLRRAQAIVAGGAQVVCLLALSDDGAPAFDHDNAAALAALGVPTFACTPDRFPDLIAAAIQRDDLTTWANNNDIQLAAPTVDG
ncbi:VWA domain-containing protein [Actinophytocola gossypii]|uniref:VWA domain-containing protein n=1 Tax=Actinophytocola gossypii TaxID=2812003 RepID=A0ABT2J7A5_9PSEU|nr:VWA domain-containing protein [Actinophytocola gossypii]MCT2583740.1 VWA domain-containing protein [Actinophytocola gossypii]